MKVTVIKIRELAEKAGLTNAYQLQKATGLQPSMAARLFKEDVEAIALRTLDKLCEALDCEPGDLLVRTSDTPPQATGAMKDVTPGRKGKK